MNILPSCLYCFIEAQKMKTGFNYLSTSLGLISQVVGFRKWFLLSGNEQSFHHGWWESWNSILLFLFVRNLLKFRMFMHRPWIFQKSRSDLEAFFGTEICCTPDGYSQVATFDRFPASVSRWSCPIPPFSSIMEIKETAWSSSCRQVDIYWTWCKTMMIRNHLDAVFSSCCRLYFSQDKTKCSFLSNALFKPWQQRYVAEKPIVVVEVSSMWPPFPSVT